MPTSSPIRRLGRALGSFALCGTSAVLVLTAAAGRALAHDTCHAPEIDAGSLASAVTLVTGGLLVLADRLRRK